MLHRIKLPDCTTHLDWIIQLQCNLLHALCNPTIGADDVTKEWVKSIRPDIDHDWMSRFCGWSTGGKPMLQRMKAVAGLSTDDKQALIQHYENNLQFPDAFDDTKPNPPATTPLPDGLLDTASRAYRDFFEMFYAPIFYRQSKRQGYPVEGGELDKRFSKSAYLEAYHEANQHLAVCPLCDGNMDGAELDHWLAKKHLPELNCHPLNLVEICSTCNSVTNKGDDLALDAESTEPFQDWPHPFLRPAEGYKIKVHGGKPRLSGSDHIAKTRLNNFDGLINLSRRWARKYDNLVTRIQERIRHHRRRGTMFDRASLLTKIGEWVVDAEAELGLGEYKLLETALLRKAEEDGTDVFEELLAYAREV